MAHDGNLPPPTFDLETYASNYEGALLPLRLSHIATHCPSLSRPALTLALAAAKAGKDVPLYTRLLTTASRLNLPDLSQPDNDWTSKTEEANRREQARLESELKGYKNNLIRESIRMGQEDLANHLLLTGGPAADQSQTPAGYHAAYQAFSRMRDYCTTPTHVASMTLRLLYTALLHAVSSQQLGAPPTTHLNSALTNAARLRTVGVKEEEMAKLTPILHASSGLAQLGLGNYADAARAFLATPPEYASLGSIHGVDFPRAVASGNDIAIYGALTALATLPREDLVDKVLGGPFRAFLELEPHVRKAISLYTTAKYQACLALLSNYAADWGLDVFLGGGGHLARLMARIREKSITAYFSSFSQVSLTSLASTFPPPSLPSGVSAEQALEAETITLIEAGVLDARLDVVNGLLIAPQKDRRTEALGEAAKTGEEVERNLLLRLGRVNAVIAGLEVPKGKMGAGQWGEVRG